MPGPERGVFKEQTEAMWLEHSECGGVKGEDQFTGGLFETVARVHFHSLSEKMGGSFQQMNDVIWRKCLDRLVSV